MLTIWSFTINGDVMNERIQELADQAEDYADSIVDQGGEFHPAYTEKLAESIVRECASIVEGSPWNLPRGYKAVDQAELVKKHFGVKE